MAAAAVFEGRFAWHAPVRWSASNSTDSMPAQLLWRIRRGHRLCCRCLAPWPRAWDPTSTHMPPPWQFSGGGTQCRRVAMLAIKHLDKETDRLLHPRNVEAWSPRLCMINSALGPCSATTAAGESASIIIKTKGRHAARRLLPGLGDWWRCKHGRTWEDKSPRPAAPARRVLLCTMERDCISPHDMISGRC